jgi:cell division protein FtsQ
LQQVGGGVGVAQRVQVAPALSPATTLPPTVASPPMVVGSVALGTPRRRMRPPQRAYGRKLGFAVFTALSGALAFSLLTDAGRDARSVAPLLPTMDEVLYWTGLRIDQVTLSGTHFTSDTDIFGAVDLPNARSLLSLDSAGVRARIEALPWIATASISRIYPGTLDIRVTERTPAALWRENGRELLIDDKGRVLSAVKPGTQTGLPRIAGEGAAAQAKALLDLIARYPAILSRFESAERVGERRWTLHLKDHITVHLGADREAAAFAALSSDDDLGKLLSGHDLIIDLRTRGRIAVRHAAEGASAAPPTQVQARS